MGARQLVVQDAAEMMVSSGVRVFSLTLYTMVGRSLPAGAEMTTFLAPASMWAWDLALAAKKPVHSSTTSTPISPQGSWAGSFSARISILWPSTVMDVSSDSTVWPS